MSGKKLTATLQRFSEIEVITENVSMQKLSFTFCNSRLSEKKKPKNCEVAVVNQLYTAALSSGWICSDFVLRTKSYFASKLDERTSLLNKFFGSERNNFLCLERNDRGTKQPDTSGCFPVALEQLKMDDFWQESFVGTSRFVMWRNASHSPSYIVYRTNYDKL